MFTFPATLLLIQHSGRYYRMKYSTPGVRKGDPLYDSVPMLLCDINQFNSLSRITVASSAIGVNDAVMLCLSYTL